MVIKIRKRRINLVSGKTTENLKNKIDVRPVVNKKDYLKWTSKPRYKIRKIFDSGLVQFVKLIILDA